MRATCVSLTGGLHDDVDDAVLELCPSHSWSTEEFHFDTFKFTPTAKYTHENDIIFDSGNCMS